MRRVGRITMAASLSHASHWLARAAPSLERIHHLLWTDVQALEWRPISRGCAKYFDRLDRTVYADCQHCRFRGDDRTIDSLGQIRSGTVDLGGASYEVHKQRGRDRNVGGVGQRGERRAHSCAARIELSGAPD